MYVMRGTHACGLVGALTRVADRNLMKGALEFEPRTITQGIDNDGWEIMRIPDIRSHKAGERIDDLKTNAMRHVVDALFNYAYDSRTKLCPECGCEGNDRVPLSRFWRCPQCGYEGLGDEWMLPGPEPSTTQTRAHDRLVERTIEATLAELNRKSITGLRPEAARALLPVVLSALREAKSGPECSACHSTDLTMITNLPPRWWACNECGFVGKAAQEGND